MKTILSLILTFSFLSSAVAHNQPTAELILSLKNRNEYHNYFYKIRDNLFNEFKNDKNNIINWNAIWHYRKFTDASATIEYYEIIYNLVKEDHLLFYSKYMEGYEKALDLMKYAINHDYTVDEGNPELVFNNIFNKIRNIKPKDKKLLIRHNKFYNTAYELFKKNYDN